MAINKNLVYEKISTITFIFISLFSLSLVLSSCTKYGYKHEPYYLNQANVLFEGSNGELYFKEGSGTVSLCKYDFEEKDHTKAIHFYNGEEKYYFKLGESNSNYLFAYLTPSKVELPPLIKVLDKSFEVINTISFTNTEQIIGLACSERSVYIYKKDSNTNTYSLIKNEFTTNSSSILIDNTTGLSNYQDDDISLFFREYNNHKYFGKYDKKTSLIYDYSNHLFTDKLFLKLSYDSIVISNCGTDYVFKKEHDFNSFYERSFIHDNNLFFATYLYLKNPDCGTLSKKCFCGVKESYLFRFDITNNKLFEIGSFKAGSFLIDYDSSSAKYYYDGGLYVNDELIKECETIQAGSLIKIGPFDTIRSYKLDYYLSFYNGQFYGI